MVSASSSSLEFLTWLHSMMDYNLQDKINHSLLQLLLLMVLITATERQTPTGVLISLCPQRQLITLISSGEKGPNPHYIFRTAPETCSIFLESHSCFICRLTDCMLTTGMGIQNTDPSFQLYRWRLGRDYLSPAHLHNE